MPSPDIDLLFADLDQETRELLKTGGLPFLFAVVSWGAAATEWLANVLNSHPDVLCLHNAARSWEKVGGAPRLNGWKYLRVIGVEGWNYRACGDVHAISLGEIADLRSKLGEHFNCAILVREPLARLRSQVALFENSPVKTAWNVDYVQRFIDQGVRLPQDTVINRLFLHGVNMLNSVVQEESVATVWRSEDLTTDAATLARFVEELTRGHVQPDLEWAQRAVRRPPANRHRAPNTPPRPFELWQVETINMIVEPQAWRIYETLGYKTPDFVELRRAG